MENAKKMLKADKAEQKPQETTNSLKLPPRSVISNTIKPPMGSNESLTKMKN